MHNNGARGFSRRDILAGAAGLTGLAALGAVAAPQAAKSHWDLVVIGGGTAGMPTATFAAARARVLVIEAGGKLGGTLDRSTGMVAAAGTVFQRERGIEDSPEAHYQDILRISDGTVDPDLTRVFVEHAGPTLNWLAANGYRVLPEHPLTGHGHEHFRTARYVWGERGGWSVYEAMQGPFEAAVASGRLQVQYRSRAIELLQARDGSVTGVRTMDADGRVSDVSAGRVVIASGGCASNGTLFEALHGVPLYCQWAHPNSQGEGITLGLGAGGFVRGGDKYTPLAGAILDDHRFPATPSGFAGLNPTLRLPWEILVNVHGRRFVREDYPSIDHIEKAVAAQPGHLHWAVFDQRILDTAPPMISDWDAGKVMNACDEHPMFARAGDLARLAMQTGVNPQGLAESVAAYNAALAGRQPDPMGLEHRPLPIAEPPFYAVRMRGWTIISFAGLAVDGQLRVLRPSGEPVPNLHAVGEVIGAGATSGAAYTNGMLVTPAVTFGRLLGQSLLEFA